MRVAHICEYTKNHWVVHFKRYVNCINKAIKTTKRNSPDQGRENHSKGTYLTNNFMVTQGHTNIRCRNTGRWSERQQAGTGRWTPLAKELGIWMTHLGFHRCFLRCGFHARWSGVFNPFNTRATYALFTFSQKENIWGQGTCCLPRAPVSPVACIRCSIKTCGVIESP